MDGSISSAPLGGALVPRAPRFVYTWFRIANGRLRPLIDKGIRLFRSDIAVAAWFRPGEPRVTTRLALAYFVHEVGHEKQHKQGCPYPQSGGEVHRFVLLRPITARLAPSFSCPRSARATRRAVELLIS